MGIAVLMVALGSRSASARPLDLRGADWEGLADLVRLARRELGTGRVATGEVISFGDLRREDGVLLVHPVRPLDVDELSAFMRAGGRVALLDDYGSGDELLARFGIRRVPLPAAPAEMLRSNPSFAVARPAGAHPLVRDLEAVVTNHATGLAHSGLSPLLVVRGQGEPDVLVAMAGAVGHGRFVAVGDSSIAMNAMLRYPGNRDFAAALVRYLVEDDLWGKRGGRLYVLANVAGASGSFGDGSPAAGAFADARRAVVDAVTSVRADGLPPRAAYAAAVALTLAVVGWTGLRVGRRHRVVAPQYVRPTSPEVQGGIAGRAARLGAAAAANDELAFVELKRALEERLAAEAGLQRSPPVDELLRALRDEAILDDQQVRALGPLFAELEARASHAPTWIRRGRAAWRKLAALVRRRADDRLEAVATQVRVVVGAVRRPDARDKVRRTP